MSTPEEQQTPPEETQPSLEKETLYKKITPTVARVTASSVLTTFTNPDVHINQENSQRTKEQLEQATPDKLDFQPVNELSKEDRAKDWEGDTRSFEEKKIEWIAEFSEHIREKTAEGEENREELTETLRWVGIEAGAEDKDLINGIEQFRENYVHRKGSNIGGFVEKIADNCLKDDGNVDLDALEQRMDVLRSKGILGVFGKTGDVKDLIKDYAMAHGLLSQKDPVVKSGIAETTVQQLNADVPEEDKPRLQRLYDKQQELLTQPKPQTSEHTSPLGLTQEVIDNLEARKAQAMEEAISKEELQNAQTLEDRHKGSIAVTSAEELDWLLESFGITDPQKRETIINELKPKFDKAQELELSPSYVFQIAKEEDTYVPLRPQLGLNIPEGLSDEEKERLFSEINAQPPTGPKAEATEPQTDKSAPTAPVEEIANQEPATEKTEETPEEQAVQQPERTTEETVTTSEEQPQEVPVEEAIIAEEKTSENTSEESGQQNASENPLDPFKEHYPDLFREKGQQFVSKNEDGTDHTISITEIDGQTGDITFQHENGGTETLDQQSFNDLLTEENFTEVQQKEDGLEVGQKLIYMDYPGEITSTEGNSFIIKLENGVTKMEDKEAFQKELLKDKPKYTLINKPTTDEANSTEN